MFKTKNSNTKKSEDVKKSAGKVLDTKKDTPTRAKVNANFIQFNFSISMWLETRQINCPWSSCVLKLRKWEMWTWQWQRHETMTIGGGYCVMMFQVRILSSSLLILCWSLQLSFLMVNSNRSTGRKTLSKITISCHWQGLVGLKNNFK